MAHEKALVKDVALEFQKADILVSYYGTGFDRPFLNAKMLEYNLPPIVNIPEIDLYYTARHKLAISRKSLANVAYYLKVPNKKTAVEGRLWKAAQVGDRKALREIEKHNIADVEVLRDVYLKLRPLVRTHPRVSGLLPCRFCGGEKLQRRGRIVSHLHQAKQRIFCKSCGGWDSRPLDKV